MHFGKKCKYIKYKNLEYKTDRWLSYYDKNENDVLSIIKNLNEIKGNGWYSVKLNWSD